MDIANKLCRKVFPISLVAGLSLGAVACSGDDAGGDGDGTASPTPVESQADAFRMTSMQIGSCDPDAAASCQGLDLDGDKTVDNNLQVTLEAMSVSIYTQIDLAMDTAEVPETPADCPDSDVDGQPDQCLSQEQVLAQLQPMLDSMLSIEAWSEALNTGVQNGDLHYLLEFEAAGSGESVVWYTGSFEEVGIVRGGKIGSQTDAEKDGLYGPGELTLTITRTLPDGTSLSLPLKTTETWSRISGRSETAIADITLGGAVRIEDMVALVEQISDYVSKIIQQSGGEVPTGPGVPGLETALETQVTASIAPYADIDLDGDGEAGEAVDINNDGTDDGDPDDGISAGFLGKAAAVVLVK